jgi:hypothetical protein
MAVEPQAQVTLSPDSGRWWPEDARQSDLNDTAQATMLSRPAVASVTQQGLAPSRAQTECR